MGRPKKKLTNEDIENLRRSAFEEFCIGPTDAQLDTAFFEIGRMIRAAEKKGGMTRNEALMFVAQLTGEMLRNIGRGE